MKRESHVPREGHVLQLLCAAPRCHVSNNTALETQQLLTSKNSAIIFSSARAPQRFSCSEVLFLSPISEQRLQLSSNRSCGCSLASVIFTFSKLMDHKSFTQMAAPPTSVVSTQNSRIEYLHIEQGFLLPDVPRDLGTRSSSRIEEFLFPVNQLEMINVSYEFVQGNQDQNSWKLQVTLLSPNINLTSPTQPMALHVVTVLIAHLPFLSPEVLRLLEFCMKKWMHFQTWGLPRCVEESLRQLVPQPPLFGQPGNSQPLPFTMINISSVCVETTGTTVHKAWASWEVSQFTQAFWVSEWSIKDPEPRQHCQKTPNSLALALPSLALKVLNGLYPPLGGQAEDSGNHLKQKHSQPFCGFPCLHSKSLVATFTGSQGLSVDKSTAQPCLDVPFLFDEPSFLPLLSNDPPYSPPPSSPPTPNWISPPDHQGIQINLPLLTLAECEALEWHLLQRQLQLRWDLPAVFQRSRHAQSPMHYEPCDTAPSPETRETSWSGEPTSVLSRQLLFFPDHVRRLLGFHLQKKLIDHHWGLPQKIEQSFKLLLSPADQKPLPWSSTALDDVSVLQSAAPEAKRLSDMFPTTMTPVALTMPHLLIQAKRILQSHTVSECCQADQGTVPTSICISQDCRIPGSLAVACLPCIPESQPLELQAATDLDLHQEVVSQMPTATDQHTSPGALIEHTKPTRSLSEEAIQKPEMTLRHRYLALLARLHALYYVAISKTMVLAITSQSSVSAQVTPKPFEIPGEPLTENISYEEQCTCPEPGFQEDKTSANGAHRLLTDVQEEIIETVPLGRQTDADLPPVLRRPTLTKWNFHLRKKVLEMQLGIPIKARKSRDQTVAGNMSTQEVFGSLTNQELAIPADTPHSPEAEWAHLKQLLITELKAVLLRRELAKSRAVPHGSHHCVSQISQPSVDEADAQVLCVQVEDSMNSTSLEEAWCTESQGTGKSKDSAHVPTLAEKKEDPEKPKPAGDHGEGDTEFGLTSTRENRHSAERQRPAGSWRRNLSYVLAVSCEDNLQLQLPKLPPGVPCREESKKNPLRDKQVKVNLITEPARIPGTPRPVLSQTSQGQPLHSQSLQDEIPRGWVTRAHTPEIHSLRKPGLRNKMKCFLCCGNPKRVDEENVSSPAKKVVKTRKKSAKKTLAKAKVPTGQVKTNKITGNSKTQPAPTERQVDLGLSDCPQALDSQLRHQPRQRLCASLLGYLHHSFRCFPLVACATRQGNPT